MKDLNRYRVVLATLDLGTEELVVREVRVGEIEFYLYILLVIAGK